MSITERSRRRVADALERLESEYSDVETVEKTWCRPPEAYEAVRERFEAGTLGGAGCWPIDDDGRVLLVRHEGGSAWSDPGVSELRSDGSEDLWSSGGKQEPGERLEEAARRETREETGASVELVGVRQAHRIEVRGEGGERSPIHRLVVVFDAEYVSGDIRPREGEIAEVRWWSERPDGLLYEELAGFPVPAAGDDCDGNQM